MQIKESLHDMPHQASKSLQLFDKLTANGLKFKRPDQLACVKLQGAGIVQDLHF